MIIEIATPSYNQRRYGKPWIALVRYPTPKGEYSWGSWVGYPGEEGLLVLDAADGDIVARGQKDHRGRSDAPDMYQVRSGKLAYLGGKADAYKAYKAEQVRRAETAAVSSSISGSELGRAITLADCVGENV